MSSEFQAVHLVEENDFSNPLKRSYRTCAVGACPSPNGASYHNFPKDPKVQKRWLLACQRQGSIPAKYGRICHHHFAPECFERDLKNELLGLKPRRLLKPGSVPTLRLDRNQRSPQCLEEDESPRAKRVKKREAKEIVNKLLSHSIIQEEARKATVQIDNELKEKKSVGISCKIFHEGQEAQLLKDKIQSLREKLRTANLEVNSLKKQVKYLKSSGHRRQDVKKVLEKTQTPAEVKRLLNPGQKHWRYSQEDMIKALVLKSMSNRTYEYLRKSRMIALPSRLTVDRWLKNSHTTPGIQHDCLKIMKETCLTFENERDSLAVLSFDKIDLKNRHEFDSETETIYGERYQTDTVLHMQIFSDDSTRLGPEEALGRVQILLLGKNYDFLIKNPYGRFEGNNEETYVSSTVFKDYKEPQQTVNCCSKSPVSSSANVATPPGRKRTTTTSPTRTTTTRATLSISGATQLTAGMTAPTTEMTAPTTAMTAPATRTMASRTGATASTTRVTATTTIANANASATTSEEDSIVQSIIEDEADLFPWIETLAFL